MSHRSLHAAGVLFIGLLSLAHPSSAQGRKLSGPMPRLGLGEIRGYRLTPDGSRIVYRADQDTDGVFELYSAPADGTGSSIKLNGPLVPGGAVSSLFQISPDGAHVVYAADAEVDDAVDLFSVPVDGSAAPVRLDGDSSGHSTGPILAFVAGRVVYEGFVGAIQASELFSAPLDGSAPARKLNAPLASGHFLWNPLVSSDGRWVVYVTDQDRPGVFELYRAPVDGSTPPVRLHPPLPDDVDAWLIAIAPDNSRVALFASGPFGNELYCIGLTGPSDPLLLTAGLGSRGRVESVGFSPDSAYVLFQFDDRLESVRLVHGATPVRLDDPFAAGDVVAYAIAPDSRRVVFANGSRDYEVVLDTLSSAPLDGSAPPTELGVIDALIEFPPETLFQIDAPGSKVVFRCRPLGENALLARELDGSAPAIRLDTPTSLHGEVQWFRVAPAGERVIYAAAPDDPYQTELFSVTSDGSAPALRLNGALRGGEVVDVQMANDGTRVAFLADQDADITERLFTAPLDGSAEAVALGSPLPLGPVVGDVLEFQVAGHTAVYRADQEADGRPGLYVVPSEGRSEARELSSPVGVSSTVVECGLSPDGTRVLYRQAITGLEELMLASTDGSASPQHLASGSFSELRFTPDGAFVLFRQASPIAGLFAAPSDGHGVPVQLSGPVLLDHSWIAPDSRRVVFVTDPTTPGVYELFSRAIDGSAPTVKLSATLVPAGDVSDVLIAPDASFVVYHADAAVNEVVELFRAPIDGSAPAQRLNGALAAGGDVQRAEIGADGTRVVYLADQRADEVFELFAVPSDGSASPVLLSGALVTGGGVASIHVAPDGRHVAFVADRELNDRFELYVAPLDGSAAPRKLNPALVPGGDVNLGFAFTPRGDQIVYRADQTQNELVELFAVPADGSAAARRISRQIETGGGVRNFQVSPHGEGVVYLVRRDAHRVSELDFVALDGRRPARRLNRPLPAGGEVLDDFEIRGDLVLYRADQDEDDVIELYVSVLGAARVSEH